MHSVLRILKFLLNALLPAGEALFSSNITASPGPLTLPTLAGENISVSSTG